MKETPWFDEKTGKRRGLTISMSLKDDADFEKGMARVAKLLGVKSPRKKRNGDEANNGL